MDQPKTVSELFNQVVQYQQQAKEQRQQLGFGETAKREPSQQWLKDAMAAERENQPRQ